MTLDCANGATHRAAPAIFERLGAEVETVAAELMVYTINEQAKKKKKKKKNVLLFISNHLQQFWQ